MEFLITHLTGVEPRSEPLTPEAVDQRLQQDGVMWFITKRIGDGCRTHVLFPSTVPSALHAQPNHRVSPLINEDLTKLVQALFPGSHHRLNVQGGFLKHGADGSDYWRFSAITKPDQPCASRYNDVWALHLMHQCGRMVCVRSPNDPVVVNSPEGLHLSPGFDEAGTTRWTREQFLHLAFQEAARKLGQRFQPVPLEINDKGKVTKYLLVTQG